jgi:hypothetical protein
MFRMLLCAALLAAAPAAFADQQQLALTAGDFAAQRAAIEKNLADGKTYAEISPADRSKVRESLARISGRLNGADSVDTLSEPIKVALFNDQELVNTILTQAADDSRLVCERSRSTGSHRATTKCHTVAERRRRMERDQEDLRQRQNGIGPLKN